MPTALGVQDEFVRIAREYSDGGYGLAWSDLQRHGFVAHSADTSGGPDPFAPALCGDGASLCCPAGTPADSTPTPV